MTSAQSTSKEFTTTVSNAQEMDNGDLVDHFSAGVYYFTLTVSKGDYSAVATTTLTLVDDVVPSVEILTDFSDKYDTSDKIIISAEIEATEEGYFTYAEFTADTTLPYESDLSNATRGATSLILRQPSTTVFQLALRPNFSKGRQQLYFLSDGLLLNAGLVSRKQRILSLLKW